MTYTLETLTNKPAAAVLICYVKLDAGAAITETIFLKNTSFVSKNLDLFVVLL